MSRRPRGLVACLSGLGLLSACSDPAPSPADASVADVAADAPAADVAGDLPSTPKVRDPVPGLVAGFVRDNTRGTVTLAP